MKNNIKGEVISEITDRAEGLSGRNRIEFEYEGYNVSALVETIHTLSPGDYFIPDSCDTNVTIIEFKIWEDE